MIIINSFKFSGIECLLFLFYSWASRLWSALIFQPVIHGLLYSSLTLEKKCFLKNIKCLPHCQPMCWMIMILTQVWNVILSLEIIPVLRLFQKLEHITWNQWWVNTDSRDVWFAGPETAYPSYLLKTTHPGCFQVAHENLGSHNPILTTSRKVKSHMHSPHTDVMRLGECRTYRYSGSTR